MNYQDELDAANLAVQDKIGQVMSSGSQIASYRNRASAYLSSQDPKTTSLAQAVVSKANGLMSNYQSIESDALTAAGNANSLRSKMNTDPTWQALINDPSSLMATAGWGTVSVVNGYVSQAVTVIAALTSLAARAQSHLSAVSDLASNVDDLDSFAQGKGLSAKLAGISSFGSSLAGLAGNYLTFAKYAAIGIGLFFVWDLAKPLVTASTSRRR